MEDIDFKKQQAIHRAASMDRVPLIQLDRLIKERNLYAKNGDIESVESINRIICQLLGIPQ